MKSFFLLCAVLVFSLVAKAKDQNLCDHIVLKEGKLRLNENEKILICGSDKGGEGWRQVPLPQAQMQLNNKFQSEGYLTPRFEREGDVLSAWSGDRSKVQSLEVRGHEELLPIHKKRKILGYPLMPSKLNEIQRWADQELRSRGYACPTVKTEAQAWDQKVFIDLMPGQRQRVGDITYQGLEGLHVDTFQRYLAFQSGDWYDIRETQLTTERLLADGLFQSAYFVTDCQNDVVHLELRSSLGKPKIFRFGVGASTEELPFTDISFRNARLDDRASSFSAVLHASNIKQSLDFGSELYWFIGYPKFFFGPRFNMIQQKQSTNDEFSSHAGGDLGVWWDQFDIRFSGRFGPTLNYAKTLAGIGPDDLTYTSLQGSLTFQNHVYELFVRNQYEGWNGKFSFQGNRKGLGSDFSVERYDFNFKYLWNIGAYSPPLFVLGWRFESSTVFAEEVPGVDVRAQLPTEYRIFIGGDQDLRGFARKSVDNAQRGYLTSIYNGFELRLVEQIPYGIQPFLLWDFAKVGNDRATLDPPIFLSEGLGVRWATPFGSLRGSAARGRIWNEDASTANYAQQWIYFFSFGQEF